MKGWGKSPPRAWQQGRHGKPRLEQDQIGTSRGLARGVHRLRCPGRSREPISNGRSRGMIVAAFRSGTKPGLQAVWHIFPWDYRPWACFRPVARCWGRAPVRRRGPCSDYPRISVFWQPAHSPWAVNLLSVQRRLERFTGCEYFGCSVYVPCL